MGDTTQFTIGASVGCEEGELGTLRRVVIDPVKHELTHLVVEASHGRTRDRLVPVDLVETSKGSLLLRCTKSQFAALEPVEEQHFLSGGRGQWPYADADVLSLPHFVLHDGRDAAGTLRTRVVGNVRGIGAERNPRSRGRVDATDEKVPAGEVALKRGDHVHASDGRIGRVHGLVVDRAGEHVTHVLLATGHLWGSREVAIPIGAVIGVDDDHGVWLALTKARVRDLPLLGVDGGGPP
ncbi:MAG: hypothetical protein ACRDWE_13000 [Acidimicrobiales bacterium]